MFGLLPLALYSIRNADGTVFRLIKENESIPSKITMNSLIFKSSLGFSAVAMQTSTFKWQLIVFDEVASVNLWYMTPMIILRSKTAPSGANQLEIDSTNENIFVSGFMKSTTTNKMYSTISKYNIAQ